MVLFKTLLSSAASYAILAAAEQDMTVFCNNNHGHELCPGGRGVRDSNGADALLYMVRAMYCQSEYPDRSLSKCPGKIHEFRAALRNYGCNCFPENFDGPPSFNGRDNSWHMGKNGKPINEVDAACTRLRDAYTCITIDVENNLLQDQDSDSVHLQDKCGRHTAYDYYIDDDKNVICGSTNDPEYASNQPEDQCAKHVCNMERQFASEVWAIIDDPENFVVENAADYGISEDESVCVNMNNGRSVSECCGAYPNRQPYIPFLKTCCQVGDGFEAVYHGECA